MKRIGLIIAILACAASADAQQRQYRPGGYYQWNKTNCGYAWQWYATPYKAAANNYSHDVKYYNLTWNNYGAKAEQGSTQYSVGNYDPLSLYAKADSSALAHLAEKFVEGGVKIGGSAFTLASTEAADRADIAKEALQVEKFKGLALIAEQTKASQSRSSVHVEHHAEVNVESNSRVDLGGIERKCSTCHAGDAASGGDVRLPPFSEFTPEQADTTRKYVTRLDERNCAKKAKLTDAEHESLIDFLCERKAGK